jgi:hypothetical protein
VRPCAHDLTAWYATDHHKCRGDDRATNADPAQAVLLCRQPGCHKADWNVYYRAPVHQQRDRRVVNVIVNLGVGCDRRERDPEETLIEGQQAEGKEDVEPRGGGTVELLVGRPGLATWSATNPFMYLSPMHGSWLQ